MRSRIALFLALATLAACDGSPSAPDRIALPVETLAHTPVSGFSSAQRVAVQDGGQFAGLWQTFHGSLRPVPAPPSVDFSRETVVLAASGTRSQGCYDVRVTGAEIATDGAVEVAVTETVPGPGCACIQAVTQPAHLVRLDRATTALRFKERRTESTC